MVASTKKEHGERRERPMKRAKAFSRDSSRRILHAVGFSSGFGICRKEAFLLIPKGWIKEIPN